MGLWGTEQIKYSLYHLTNNITDHISPTMKHTILALILTLSVALVTSHGSDTDHEHGLFYAFGGANMYVIDADAEGGPAVVKTLEEDFTEDGLLNAGNFIGMWWVC